MDLTFPGRVHLPSPSKDGEAGRERDEATIAVAERRAEDPRAAWTNGPRLVCGRAASAVVTYEPGVAPAERVFVSREGMLGRGARRDLPRTYYSQERSHLVRPETPGWTATTFRLAGG